MGKLSDKIIDKDGSDGKNNEIIGNDSSPAGVSRNDIVPPFPSEHLLPKAETGAMSFLKSHPTYDGRGVTVGILDTGVDPGAIGLSSLPYSDEDKKVIHVADCTGSGDVEMNMETDAVYDESKECWVVEKGLLGRPLTLCSDWTLKPFPDDDNDDKTDKKSDMDDSDGKDNEKGESVKVRLGLKRAYELFPKKLVSRVKEHRQNIFDQQQRLHSVRVRAQLKDWEDKYGNDTTTKVTQDDVRNKENLLALLEVLESKESDSNHTNNPSNDPGPIYQIVLFYDGESYRVAIDSSETQTGDLTNAKAMTDYKSEKQYATFSNIDMFNYAINVYNSGKVVSIVVDAGAHGTHVAGITSAFHKNNEFCDSDADVTNGVAPGAKIVSLKIGDSRLGSMETGTALTRALIEAIKHKCDVINLSYGEGCALPNCGRFVKLAEDLVHKHGIMFVSSAGNNGPCLSTVGAPGGTSEAILGVAAYVSTDMMKAEYSLSATKDGEDSTKEEDNYLKGTTYTWSSVGPTADGALGVNITAPGAAITCVPNWCLQRNQLMNGTSMSSPNTAGCVALLLSAAKAEGINVTPSRLMRAIANSALFMEGLSSLQQGSGMIQVEKAWEHIKMCKDDSDQDINFKIRIDNRAGQPRGVYLRQPEETCVKHTFSVNVDPIFRTNDDVDLETQWKRVEFEMKFRLQSTASWIRAPEFFMLMHNGRSFKFDVDPTKLPAGSLHTEKIFGYDTTKPASYGPMFHIPITVAKPMKEELNLVLGEIDFAPAEVRRFFLNVPAGATWMDVTIKDARESSVDQDASSRLVNLHTVQLLPHQAYRFAEEKKYFNLLPSQETVTSIPIYANITCELALARYWSTIGETKMNISVRFRGIRPLPDTVTMLSGGGGANITLHSDLRDEFVLPSAKLVRWTTPICPKAEGAIAPLDERDIIPTKNKQIYQLLLLYEFEQEEEGEFIPRAPALQGVLYESAYESQLMLIYDGNKKYLGVADSWPSKVKAPKGKITIRLQVRHDDIKMLEKLKNLSIWIERKIDKEITLSAYSSRECMMEAKTMGKQILRKGTCASVFFGEPKVSELPSGCKCGDVFEGMATYASGGANLPGAGKRPGGFQLKYVVGKKVDSKNEKDVKVPELPDERSVNEKIDEAIRSLKIGELQKLSTKPEDDTKFEILYDSLMKEYVNYLPLLSAGLTYFDRKDKRKESLLKIIEIADTIIKNISETDLAVHYGMGYDKEDPKSCKERKDMDEKKVFLIEALSRKVYAIADIEKSGISVDGIPSFDNALKHLTKWEDIDTNKKFSVLLLEREKRAGRFGTMLKLLNSLLKKEGEDTKGGICPLTKLDLLSKRAEVFKELGYMHLLQRDEIWKAISSPKVYSLF